MTSVLIYIRDFLKTWGKSNKISEDTETQQIQLSDDVECYYNSFVARNDMFDHSQFVKFVIPN